MSNNIHLPVLSGAEEQQMRDLYQRFIAHVTQLYAGMNDHETFEEFVVWWTGLDAANRRKFEKDMDKGCEVMLQETRARLDRLTRK